MELHKTDAVQAKEVARKQCNSTTKFIGVFACFEYFGVSGAVSANFVYIEEIYIPEQVNEISAFFPIHFY